MLGLGYMQIVGWTLTNPKLNFTEVALPASGMTETLNPLTADFTALRTHLLPNMLRILSENRHNAMPQKIFALGPVYDGEVRAFRACWC